MRRQSSHVRADFMRRLTLTLLLCSCASLPPGVTARRSVIQNPPPALVKMDYTIPGRVPIIKQPNKMACWAAVATMLLSWRDSRQYEIEEALQKAGPGYVQTFRSRRGLDAEDKTPFLKALSLRAEAPQSFTPKGWLSLLESHGPLWTTTQVKRERESEEKFSVHARIIIGIYEGGEAGDIFFRIIDPESGTQYDESFIDFLRRYENIARDDLTMGTEFQPQVIHF